MRDNLYMKRCLELALLGLGYTAPNPLVGSVVVYNDTIIGEGYHKEYGDSHAEVNAINNVRNSGLLPYSTLYVNLEPCCHHGKTLPCTDLIIKSGIKKVVIGSVDIHHVVAGKGISKLRNSGCDVRTGVLKNECLKLNRRFFTFHEKKRPYIILKWAQSADGFIDFERPPETAIGPNWITSKYLRMLVHKWRAQEQSIMAGTNTVLKDNPSLNVRLWHGKNPLRIVIDNDLKISKNFNVLDNSQSTLIINKKKEKEENNTKWLKLNCSYNELIQELMNYLYTQHIQSVFVEGGRELLQSFIDQGFWDEARIFSGQQFFAGGTSAPLIRGKEHNVCTINKESLFIVYS